MNKILILHPHFTIAGGAGTFVLEVGHRLVARGFTVTVCSIRSDEKIVGPHRSQLQFIDLGGPLSSSLLHWLALPFYFLKILRLGSEVQPDVVFAQVFPANWWGFLYKLFRPRTKLLWMCQEPSAFIHSRDWIKAIRDPFMSFLVRALNPLLSCIDRFLAKQVDFVFANSQYGARYAAQVYGYDEDKLAHVYLGVQEKFLSQQVNTAPCERGRQFICVCRLTKFKNVETILKALALLLEQGLHDVQFKIVGLGEEMEALRNFSAQHQLEKNVQFCGAVSNDELVQLLATSRALVLASVNEPFGLAVVEAMACGTPAVVVENGGPSEIVEHDRSGFLVPPHDPAAIASKLKLLLENDSTFQRLSRAALLRSQTFDWDKTTTTIEERIKILMRS